MRIRKSITGNRKRLSAAILSLVIGMCLMVRPMVAFAATVDNSVDKSTTQVFGQFMITYSCTEDDFMLTVYESEKMKVDYSNPKNDYIDSLIAEAVETAERVSEIAYANSNIESVGIIKPTVTNKFENSYDNRVYSWVQDDESDDGIVVGGPGAGGAAGNQNRHMVIEGDYARTTQYTVVVEIYCTDHLWDDGVVTKEATETEEGVRTFTCAGCGETKTESIPMLEPEQVIIDKPVYRGDITADGMIHQITEFYDFSTLPEGTVIYREIDEETSITLDVHGDLSPLELRLPVETSFSLILPEGYVFAGEEASGSMECTVRVIDAGSEQPTEPTEPEQPTEPSEPEQPTEPSEPEQPNEPSEPEQPTEPSEPEQPTEPSEPEQPTEPSEPEQPTEPSEPDELPVSPETGDNSHMFLWAALLVLSCGTVASTVLYDRKRKYNDK